MIGLTLRLFRGELALALVLTFITRSFTAAGGIVFFIVLGRLFGAEGVGVFVVAQSIYIGSGILARYGMDNALMRYVGQDPRASEASVYLRWALTKSALLSTLAAIVVFFLRYPLGRCFELPILSTLLTSIAFAIPPFTLSFVLAGFMKGIRKPAIACLLENGGIAMLATVLVLLLHSVTTAGIAIAGWAIAISAWLVFSLGLWQARFYLRSNHRCTDANAMVLNAFNSSSNAFFLLSLAPFMQQVVFILIAGLYLNDAELGLFKVAERTALLINFVLITINAVFPPRFARLYKQGKFDELISLVKKGVYVGLLVASPLLLVCIAFPKWLLGFYGPEFLNAHLMLQIIAIGQGLNLATGSIDYLLNMTGNEVIMRNIAIISNLLGLGILVILLPYVGLMAPAIAFGFILVFQNFVTLYFTCRTIKSFKNI